MNIWVFLIFTALGAMVWNIILAFLGWWLAQHVSLDMLYTSVEKYNSYLTMGGLALLVLCVAYLVYNAFKGGKKEKAQ